MNFSFQFKLFFGFASLLFILNIILMNDYSSIINGAESDLVLAAQDSTFTWAILPEFFTSLFLQIADFQEFILRLPSILVLVSSLLGFYFFGRKLFGQRTTLVTILVLMSSLLVPNLSKWATGDVWLFGSQLLSITTLILYLKKPTRSTLVAHYIFVAIGSLVNAWTMSLLLIPTLLFYIFRHPQGAILRRVWSFALPVLVGVLIQFGLLGTPTGTGSFLAPFTIPPLQYLGITLLGVLPWFAFVPAAVVDMLAKLKRKEEFSLLIAGWLLGGLLSYSLGAQAILALLIAKQIEAFFKPNYPYTNWVKTFAALNIIAAFIGGIFIMLNGFYALEMEGFRLGMSIGSVYWIPAFLGVVGIFGKNNRLITGGMALSGLLLTFFFWTRGGLVVEEFRNLPKQIVTQASQTGKNGDLYFFGTEKPADNYFIYAKQKFKQATFIRLEDFSSIRPSIDDVIVFQDSIPPMIIRGGQSEIDTIQGRNLELQEEKWLIMK